MDAQALLRDLRAAGLDCRAEDDRLIVKPASRIDPPLRAVIRAHKAVLLQHLRQEPANEATSAPQVPIKPATPGLPAWFPADDRITCAACTHFTPPGCRACRQGLFSFRARDHQPDPERLHRCFNFRPLEQDPDQRPGAERWPDLGWQRRAKA